MMLATYTVNVDFDEADGILDGQVSLRDAIQAAATAGDIIDFAPSLNGATLNLTLGTQIEFGKSLIIDASNLSRGITIDASSADPTPTQNNGDGIRIFNITNPSGSTSVTLKGLTLTGGDVAGAGGAIQSVASLTLQECVITGNASQSTGGGVHFNGNGNAALQVIASTISGNSALGNGGGIRAYLSGTSSFSLTDATISGNTADVHGGGVFAVANATDQNSTQQMITVARSVVSGNAAGFTGGGMYLKAIGASRIHVEDTRMTDNEASLKGGGLYAFLSRNGDPQWSNGRFTLTRSTVDDNRAGMEGGGVFLCGKHGGNFVATNSTISGNQTLDSTSGQGGGIRIARELYYNIIEADLRNVTITKNMSATGGGLRVMDADDIHVRIGNSIISENFNHAGTSPNNLVGRVVDEVFKHNLIGSGSTFLDETGVSFTPDGTNITSNNFPALNNAPGLSELGLFGGPTPTHRLMLTSPAIDKGSATIASTAPALTTDQRGTGFSRTVEIASVANGADGHVDIGAFETGYAPLNIVEVTVKSSTADQMRHPPYNFSTVAGSGQQLKTVPVGDADTVDVKFSTAVANEGTAGMGAITMRGLTTGTTLVVAQYTYTPGTNTASWRFTKPGGGVPTADQYVISISDVLHAGVGNNLDGEWTNPFSVATANVLVSEFPTGNGTPLGNFNFAITLLPGDANLSNLVDGSDFNILSTNFGMSPRNFQQADFNGDGTVNSADNNLLSVNFSKNFMILIYADFNQDGVVDNLDLAIWTAHQGTGNEHSEGDADHNGAVNGNDFVLWQTQLGVVLTWVF